MQPFPIKDWIASGLQLLHREFGFVFDALAGIVTALDTYLVWGFQGLPPYVLVLLAGAALVWRRGAQIAIPITLGLLVVWNLGLWGDAVETTAEVLVAVGISIILGVPLGIVLTESTLAARLLTPILDYMQTTPAFVYLIPSVLFFGIGTAPGIFTTVLFALPPLARNVALGIREADPRVIESAEALGATRTQLLRKVKLPLALPYFATGTNQCVMMSPSMVVMASLIGARGLGTIVVASLAQVDFPMGIESGLAVVAVAITLDQISRPKRRRAQLK
jgi:glycine betaine/proline transport system permease protein